MRGHIWSDYKTENFNLTSSEEASVLDAFWVEIVMNELRRFKYSADFFANSSHIIKSAAISAS